MNEIMTPRTDGLRIVMLTNRFAPSIGGVERQCGILAQEFVRRGHIPMVFTERYSRSFPAFETDAGVEIHRLASLMFVRRFANRLFGPMKSKMTRDVILISEVESRRDQAWHRRAAKMLYRLIVFKLPIIFFALSVFITLIRQRRRYDVIQVFQTQVLAFAACAVGAWLKKPVVARESAINDIDQLDDFPFARLTKRFVLRHCHFVALSRAISENMIARGMPNERVIRINNSVREASCQESIEKNPCTVLFVGNMTNDPMQKGLDILLKAWRAVMTVVPMAILTVVGDGNFAPFKDLAASLGIARSVRFTGPRTDRREIYGGQAIFVLPSRYEGMSNALLEAMAAGVCCVATRISGSDDLITDRVNGIKVEPGDVDGLSTALIELCVHPSEAAALGQAAQVHVRTHHDPEMIAQQYLDLYDRLQPGRWNRCLPPIVILANSSWNFIHQREHELAKGLARLGYPVFYFEEMPSMASRIRDLVAPAKSRKRRREIPAGVTVLQPPTCPTFFRSSLVAPIDEALLHRWLRKVIVRDRLEGCSLLYSFAYWRFLNVTPRMFDASISFYDLSDDASVYARTASSLRRIASASQQLLGETDGVLYSSRAMETRNELGLARRRIFLPNGLAREFIDRAPEPKPRRNAPITVGYVGVQSPDVVDVALLARVQDETDAVLRLGGFVGGWLRRALEKTEFTGVLARQEVITFIDRCDACILPFLVNARTEVADPVTMYEYFSRGKPVVAMKTRALEPYGDMLYLAQSHDEFLALIVRALEEDCPEKQRQRIDFARRNTWAHRAATLAALMPQKAACG